jgi:ubiquinone/menaquinone biosynthesis C-methylase UbiE
MGFAARVFDRCFPNDINHFDGYKTILGEYLTKAHSALDIGCGDNSILSAYRSADREIWGTDLVVHPHLQSPEWFRKLGTRGQIPFPDATFDVVTCISVLEHVEDGEMFFREVSRVLKPSGFFIGHSISGTHYVTFPTCYHLNRMTEIDEAAATADLSRRALYRYADQGYFSVLPPLVPIATVTDRVLERISDGWGRLYFTVILQKVVPEKRPD